LLGRIFSSCGFLRPFVKAPSPKQNSDGDGNGRQRKQLETPGKSEDKADEDR